MNDNVDAWFAQNLNGFVEASRGIEHFGSPFSPAEDSSKEYHKVDDRTGVGTISRVFETFSTDLTTGFPALSLKKLAWKPMVEELLGFLRGYDNSHQFSERGCNIWNQNANENKDWLANPARKGDGDLGRIYGVQWRGWSAGGDTTVDQLYALVSGLLGNPAGRRHIVTAWNPSELKMMALPPCHVLWQCSVHAVGARKELSLTMYQRSADLFLGVPFNIASYALLTHILAYVTGYDAKCLHIVFNDFHLYSNHVLQAEHAVTRGPLVAARTIAAPELEIVHAPYFSGDDAPWERLAWILDKATYKNFALRNYDPFPAIEAPMAV